MQRNGPPLLLLLAAILAVSPSAHDATSTESTQTTGPSEPAPGEELGDSARRTQSARELARLYDAFFGKSATISMRRGHL